MSRWGVVLAGGVGSRFWPLSTPARPKQFLPLVDDEPLLANTVTRLAPLVPPDRVLILTGAPHVQSVRAMLPDVPPDQVIGEPRAGGTGGALAWAAADVVRRDRPDAVMMSVHADWAVARPAEFRSTLALGAQVAEREQSLVTVGVVPTRPDPGFGYIQPGASVDGARRVARFVEKPDRARAERMVREGCLWNSGIFVWRAGDFLDEVRARTPELAGALPLAERGDLDGYFATLTPITVDHGVLERSPRVLVIPGDFGWDDVGTWAALRRVRHLDPSGNAVGGRAHVVESSGNVAYADATQAVVLYGVSNLVVVAREGITMVTTVERAADLKRLVDALPAELRDRA